MKTLINLTLIYFKEQFNSLINKKLKGTKKQGNTKSTITTLLIMLLISGLFGFSLYTTAYNLSFVGLSHFIIIIGVMFSMFLSLAITLNDTQGIYKAKDYDLLMSLPIKNVYIVTAKCLSYYLISLLYFTLVALPTFVCFFIFNGVTFVGIIYSLLALLFMPAFGQLLSCLVSFIVTLISSKMKNNNIIRTIFSLIVFAGIMIFFQMINSNAISGELFINGFPFWFKIVFSSTYFLFLALTTGSFLYFLYAFLISFAFLSLAVLIISLGFKKINSSLFATKKGKAKPIIYKESAIFKNLLKKEAKTLFNSPIYCINSLMGALLCIVFTAVFSFSNLANIDAFSSKGRDIFTAIMFFILALYIGIAPTTSVSISMEGKKFQALKSLPIKFKDIVLSKCSLNLFISVPAILISIIMFTIVAKVSFVLFVVALCYLLVSTFSQTLLGLFMNLKFPKLNWTSETQAVKGSASMLLTMLINTLLAMLPMILYFVLSYLKIYIEPIIYLPLCLIYAIIIASVILTIFIKKAEKLYNKIYA